jgi:hypothetical protein
MTPACRVPQNEVSFSSFAEFKKAYFMPFLVTFQKLAVEKGVAKDEGAWGAAAAAVAGGVACSWGRGCSLAAKGVAGGGGGRGSLASSTANCVVRALANLASKDRLHTASLCPSVASPRRCPQPT